MELKFISIIGASSYFVPRKANTSFYSVHVEQFLAIAQSFTLSLASFKMSTCLRQKLPLAGQLEPVLDLLKRCLLWRKIITIQRCNTLLFSCDLCHAVEEKVLCEPGVTIGSHTFI